eukprot:TRINITY_DN12800_c0_g1_i1.p1 TRINITY_DN12800_c0_g1~~TRINITY_DN12800_c0_g1_i1.p1  ORF type:complete len:470 (+),score=174.05 TRINITY_DN12800_c0_g1_i1:69-1412(+)
MWPPDAHADADAGHRSPRPRLPAPPEPPGGCCSALAAAVAAEERINAALRSELAQRWERLGAAAAASLQRQAALRDEIAAQAEGRTAIEATMAAAEGRCAGLLRIAREQNAERGAREARQEAAEIGAQAASVQATAALAAHRAAEAATLRQELAAMAAQEVRVEGEHAAQLARHTLQQRTDECDVLNLRFAVDQINEATSRRARTRDRLVQQSTRVWMGFIAGPWIRQAETVAETEEVARGVLMEEEQHQTFLLLLAHALRVDPAPTVEAILTQLKYEKERHEQRLNSHARKVLELHEMLDEVQGQQRSFTEARAFHKERVGALSQLADGLGTEWRRTHLKRFDQVLHSLHVHAKQLAARAKEEKELADALRMRRSEHRPQPAPGGRRRRARVATPSGAYSAVGGEPDGGGDLPAQQPSPSASPTEPPGLPGTPLCGPLAFSRPAAG